MNVVVVILVDGDWIPAHPGKLTSSEDIEYLINTLQADGYQTGIVPAERWNTPLPTYKLDGLDEKDTS